MADSFYVTATAEGVSDSARWDVLRVAVEEARKLFIAQAKGAWIVQGSGRTSDSKTFRRANVQSLRQAFEDAYASPRAVDFIMRPTIGRAKVEVVSVMSWFDSFDKSVRLSAMGSDRIKVETFAHDFERALTSSHAFSAAAPTATVEVGEISVLSDDNKRAVEVGGAFFLDKLLVPIIVTVVGGLILSIVLSAVGAFGR